MRTVATAVTGSILAHVVLGIGLAVLSPEEKPREAPLIGVEILVAEPDRPSPLAGLPPAADDEVRRPPAKGQRPTATNDRTAGQGPSTTEPSVGAVLPPAAATPGNDPAGSSAGLSMRAPKPADLTDWKHLLPAASPSAAPPALPPPPSGELRSRAGGRARAETGAFVAEVAADGSVDLRDRPNFHWQVKIPGPRTLGQGLARWADDPYGEVRAADLPPPPERLNDAVTRPDDPKPDHGKTVTIIGGGFDLTDWAMRSSGSDPYASAKLAFLDRTRDQRVAMGTQYRAAKLAGTEQMVRHQAERLWQRTELTVAEKKRGLFDLWDDCAETGEPAVVDAGQRARRFLIGFIRARLPAGSTEAYSEAELRGFARIRKSKRRFAPYADEVH